MIPSGTHTSKEGWTTHGRNPIRDRKGFSLYGKGKDRAALYVGNRLIVIQDGMFIICSRNLLAVAMM